MRSYVIYEMHGFNRTIPRCKDKWYVTLRDNHEYIYENHDFLYSVFIDDHLTSIRFDLKEGLSCENYRTQISDELEEITFNIISRFSELQIVQPVCYLKTAVDCNGQELEVKMYDHIGLHDDIFFLRKLGADEFYKAGVETETAIRKKKAMYKELFFMLHSPHKVVQYLGIYDIMSDLICNKFSKHVDNPQTRVKNFFGKNKERYSFVSFENSLKGNKEEDIFTHLRNKIAHSKQAGIDEYLKATQDIPFQYIQYMLVVINDLLCEKVEP